MTLEWDAEGVRHLRERLGVTQAELAERIGTRQQTVSEWETGHSAPRRMSQRLLRMVAEEAGVYDAHAGDQSTPSEPPPSQPATPDGATPDGATPHRATSDRAIPEQRSSDRESRP